MESIIKKKNIKLTEASFSECLVDLGKLKINRDILIVFPELRKIHGFPDYEGKWKQANLTNTMVIKYIIAMYDHKSPFASINKYELTYDERKMCAAEYARFDINESGVFTEYAQEIMRGENPIAVQMIVQYCAKRRGAEYATYIRFEMKYYDVTLMDEKMDLTKVDRELKLLNDYRDKILAYDNNVKLKEEFYKIVSDAELEIRKYRPEFKAKQNSDKPEITNGSSQEK